MTWFNTKMWVMNPSEIIDEMPRLAGECESWLDSSRVDKDAIRNAVNRYYRASGCEPSKRIIWCGNPLTPMLAVTWIVWIGDITRRGDGSDPSRFNLGPQIEIQKDARENFLKRMFVKHHTSHQCLLTSGVSHPLNIVFDTVIGELLGYLDRNANTSPKDFILDSWLGTTATYGFGQSIVELARLLDETPNKSLVRLENVLLHVYHGPDKRQALKTLYCEFQRSPLRTLAEVIMYRIARRTDREIPRLELYENFIPAFYANGGWLFKFHEETAFVVLKPMNIKFDDRGSLHNDAGPAISFRDECSMYFHHGALVPGEFVDDPRKLPSRRILTEENVEIRRMMIARKGMHAFLEEAGPELLDADYERVHGRKDRPSPRKLYRVRFRSRLMDDPLFILHVIDPAKIRRGEPADVFLRVPPDIDTCAKAVAWTFGFEKAEEYCAVAEE